MSSTGVAGLTLGGGLGWLMGVCGLAVDSVRSIQVVTANGHVVNASAVEAPDLFWAMRGGGGNFGVATSFEFGLHPIGPKVTGGLLAHPFAAARDVLRHYRDVTADAPDALTAFAGLVHTPDGVAKLAAYVACHCGPLDGRGARDAVAQDLWAAGHGRVWPNRLHAAQYDPRRRLTRAERSTTGSRASWPR